jgi:predicted DNA-binding transcriptional regulator AlpA
MDGIKSSGFTDSEAEDDIEQSSWKISSAKGVETEPEIINSGAFLGVFFGRRTYALCTASCFYNAQEHSMSEKLLSDRDLSGLTGRSRSSLQKDRLKGDSIPFVRIGRLVRYRLSDVETWLASLPSRRSTSEADEAV